MRRIPVGLATLLVAVAAVPAALATQTTRCASSDWTAFGRTASHGFATAPQCSQITASTVATLVPQWFFHAKDSVTASPAVADGTVYVGSWDGIFYAIDEKTGALRWSFQTRTHAGVAFGRIVSSANVFMVRDPRTGAQSTVVLFGGGSSLWALDAKTGAELATLDLDPRTPALRRKQESSANPPVVEIESSPAISMIGGRLRIFVGMDTHNTAHVGRTGLISTELVYAPSSAGGRWQFSPKWKYDVETGHTYTGAAGLTTGSGQGWGCGGVWSSPAVDPSSSTVAFGTASCDNQEQAYDAGENYAESMVALDAATGRLRWRYRPADELATKAARIQDAHRDADFGASPNIFKLGTEWVVGEGRKSAEYYVRDLRTGKKVSTTLAGQEGMVQDNFGVGGFLGTTAVGQGPNGAVEVVGATAIPFPQAPTDLDRTSWAVRAIDPRSGTVTWTYRLAGPSYAHTTIVNGVALVPDTTNSTLIALDAATGLPLWEAPVIGPPSSTAVVAGNSVFVGTGTRETDLEFKAFSNSLQNLFGSSVGESPVSPVSGVQAFGLAQP